MTPEQKSEFRESFGKGFSHTMKGIADGMRGAPKDTVQCVDLEVIIECERY
jgi:hypothetical protein